jgi:hypothetical protein
MLKSITDLWAFVHSTKPLLGGDKVRSSSWVDCLLIAVAIFIPYHQVAAHKFIEFDDAMYIYQNRYIISGLTWDGVVWAFQNMDAANWHPLTWITYFIDRELWGPYPGGYMLTNVAWHISASCFCYLAFRRVTLSRFLALSVALVFALHPGNVENVAWISERKSLLDALFWFIGIIAYIDYIEGRGRHYYGLLIITHLLGLMSKAMHVTFPCTLVLVHLLHANAHQESFSKVLWRSMKLALPLLLISAYFAILTTEAQTIAMMDWTVYPLSHRLVNVISSYGKYLSMFFSPRDFAVFYPLFLDEINYTLAIWPGLLLVALTMGSFAALKRTPIYLIGWFWFLGTMVPVIGLIQVGSQSHADRYLYIPTVGLALWMPFAVSAVSGLLGRVLKPLWLTVTGVSLAMLTSVQVSYWADGVTLFRHSAEVTGDCMTSVICVAGSYCRNDRPREAIAYLTSKILVSKNPGNRAMLKSLKASALAQVGDNKAAYELGKEALTEGNRDMTTLWTVAASAYSLGLLDEAAKYLDQAMVAPSGRWSSPSMQGPSEMREGMAALRSVIAKKRAGG